MKFIKLRHVTIENLSFTVNIDKIDCIETYLNSNGTTETKVYLAGSDEPIRVKETEEEILQTIEQHLNPDNLYLPLYPNT